MIDERQLKTASDRVPVSVENPLHVMGVVHMGIEMDQVQGPEAAQAPDGRVRDRMIAANYHRQGTARCDLFNGPG